MPRVRVVHYLNQFFGGVGGEERANLPVDVREGPVGPGRLLGQASKGECAVAASIVGGDNYMTENTPAALAAVRAALERFRPDVVVAGPAFDAGRYGLACGAVCRAAHEYRIPALTAMYPENPGVAFCRRDVVILPTGADVAEMAAVMVRLASLALKLGAGAQLGPAEQEGYIPRGFRRPGFRDKSAWQRAIEMAVAKTSGRPFLSEIPFDLPERVVPAAPVRDVRHARLGLVTTGGLVPRGNPDRLVRGNAERFLRYSLDGLDGLSAADWECVHRGFYTQIVNQNPNYILPLDTISSLEREGEIGGVYPWVFTTSGVGTAVAESKRMGAEIAAEMKANGVEAALLVAT